MSIKLGTYAPTDKQRLRGTWYQDTNGTWHRVTPKGKQGDTVISEGDR